MGIMDTGTIFSVEETIRWAEEKQAFEEAQAAAAAAAAAAEAEAAAEALTEKERQDAIWDMLYPGVEEAFDIAGETVSAAELFEASRIPLDRAYTQNQEQNRAWLQMAGLATSGAGYTEGTPYDQINYNYAEALANMSLQATIQAPQMALSNLGQAMSMGMGVQGQKQGDIQWDRNFTEYIRQYDLNLKAMKDAANQAKWAGLGEAALGAAGTIGGFMLAGPPGAAAGNFASNWFYGGGN